MADLDDQIASRLAAEDVPGALAALAALPFAEARRWCVGNNFCGAHAAPNLPALLSVAKPRFEQLTPTGRDRRRAEAGRNAAVLEAEQLLRLRYATGCWPLTVPGECMTRFGLTYAEFNAESGMSSPVENPVPSERIAEVVREHTARELRRLRASVERHAPGRADLLSICDRLLIAHTEAS